MPYRGGMPTEPASPRHDLIVVGGNLAGLSIAVEATEAGLERVLVIESGSDVAAPAVVGQHGLRVARSETVHALRRSPDGVLVVTDATEYLATAVVVATRPDRSAVAGPPDISGSLVACAAQPPAEVAGAIVLVVGPGEDAAEQSIDLARQGASVVLALGGGDPAGLSRLARRTLLHMEAERRMTVLWVSRPDAVVELDGRPVAYFADSRTPDLAVDHVVYVPPPAGSAAGLGAIDIADGDSDGLPVWWACEFGRNGSHARPVAVAPGEAWQTIRRACFAELAPPSGRPRVWRPGDQTRIDELRQIHYNAVITRFDRVHPDLWRIRIRPDDGDTAHLAGQYVTLGLGYWEPRVDAARDRGIERRWHRLVRRSYSISSPIFDADGSLTDPSTSDTLEFYIVLVSPSPDRVPGLTPRLAVKRDGDRIHLGARVAGHYTLEPITDPTTHVVLFSTGTGEAPHNAMAAELLRAGHQGPIVGVACVRHRRDLGYLAEHRRLEAEYPNYHYFPLVTRDPSDGVRRYIQDVIAEDLLAAHFGIELRPADTHVFLCGNPAMIGVPTRWSDAGVPVFEGDAGACQLLFERGFTIDRRGLRGNVHFEKYW